MILRLQYSVISVSLFTWISLLLHSYTVSSLATISTLEDCGFLDSTIGGFDRGFDQIFVRNETRCRSLCLSNVYCDAYTWQNPVTCTLHQTSLSPNLQNLSKCGFKVSSGASTPPFSLSFTSFPSESPDFFLYSSALFVDSKIKLAFSGSQGGYVALVDPIQLLKGSTSKCAASSFSTSFSFQFNNLRGMSTIDGFSFFLKPNRYLGDPSSIFCFPTDGSIGIAFEYDTFQNTQFNDSDSSHIGLDINFDLVSTASVSTLKSGITLGDSKVKYSWIDYDSSQFYLSVFISTSPVKPTKALLATRVNLCDILWPIDCPSCGLLPSFYAGFSASTGENNYDSIDILSWSFNASLPTVALPTSTCASVPGITFGDSELSRSRTSTLAACCISCSASQSCMSYLWRPSEKTCILRSSALQTVQSSLADTGGYITIPPYDYLSNVSISRFLITSPLFLLSSYVTENVLRMTDDSNQLSYAYLRQPLTLLQNMNNSCVASSLSINFAFRVSGGADQRGHGFALLLSSANFDRQLITSYNDYDLGLTFSGDGTPPGFVAVEFDNYQDPEVGDPPAGHMGINIGFNAVSVVTAMTQDFGIQLDDKAVKNVWVDFDARLQILSVYIGYLSLKPKAPILEYGVDLCQLLRPPACHDCSGLNTAYLGFSAHTTSLYQTLDIISLQVRAIQGTPENLWPVPYRFGFIPLNNPPTAQNNLFRYLSFGYLSQTNVNRSATWRVALEWNWTVDTVGPLLDQGGCGSCFAFATASAIESALYIGNYSPAGSIPALSTQQITQCVGSDGCSGGSLVDSLNYAATTGLVAAASYPYIANSTTGCSVPDSIRYKISSFEKVSVLNWMGLLIAVQQQPVIVAVEGSAPSFMLYKQGDSVFDDPNCYVNGVDHSVVIVGYSLTAIKPYWILRNSWGKKWGEGGYMRMAIRSGDGVCGINTYPGYIPIPAFSDSCNSNSYPVQTGLKTPDNAPGRMNPCGGGPCSIVSNGNTCDCPNDFLPAVNRDGSTVCAPKNPCTFFTENPCNFGTCVNSANSPGAYSCICPIGFDLGTYAADGTATCVPTAQVSGLKFYTVPAGYNVTCSLIYQLYGILRSTFLQQNKNLDCSGFLPAGTMVNVTNDFIKGCAVPYSINLGDTCEKIRVLFGLQSLNGPNSPNPDLDCAAKLQLGQQVCIIRNSASTNTSGDGVPLCTSFYPVQPSDTCTTVIKNQFNNRAVDFFYLNPGLYCGNFNAVVISNNRNTLSQRICISATTVGTILEGCTERIVSPQSGDTCDKIRARHFCGKQRLFTRYNKMWKCTNNRLYIGSNPATNRSKICAPKKC